MGRDRYADALALGFPGWMSPMPIRCAVHHSTKASAVSSGRYRRALGSGGRRAE